MNQLEKVVADNGYRATEAVRFLARYDEKWREAAFNCDKPDTCWFHILTDDDLLLHIYLGHSVALQTSGSAAVKSLPGWCQECGGFIGWYRGDMGPGDWENGELIT